jgi:hypothetical protein
MLLCRTTGSAMRFSSSFPVAIFERIKLSHVRISEKVKLNNVAQSEK